MNKPSFLFSSSSASTQTFLSRLPQSRSQNLDSTVLNIASSRIRECALGNPKGLQAGAHLDVFYKQFVKLLEGPLSEDKFVGLFNLARQNNKLDYFLEALHSSVSYEKISSLIIPLLEKYKMNNARSYFFIVFFLNIVLSKNILSKLNTEQLSALEDVILFYQVDTIFRLYSDDELMDIYIYIANSIPTDENQKFLDLIFNSMKYKSSNVCLKLLQNAKVSLLDPKDVNNIHEQFKKQYFVPLVDSELGIFRAEGCKEDEKWEDIYKNTDKEFIKLQLISFIEGYNEENINPTLTDPLPFLEQVFFHPKIESLSEIDVKEILVAALEKSPACYEAILFAMSKSLSSFNIFEKVLSYSESLHTGDVRQKFKEVVLSSIDYSNPEICIQFLQSPKALLFSKEDCEEISILFNKKYGTSLLELSLPFFYIDFVELNESSNNDVWYAVYYNKDIQVVKALFLEYVKRSSCTDINTRLKGFDVFYEKIFSHPNIEDLSAQDIQEILLVASNKGLLCRSAVLLAMSNSSHASGIFKKIRSLTFLELPLVNAIYRVNLTNNSSSGLSYQEIRDLTLECRDSNIGLSKDTVKCFYRNLSEELFKRSAECNVEFLVSMFQEALEHEIPDPLLILLQSPISEKLSATTLEFFIEAFQSKYHQIPIRDLDSKIFQACENGSICNLEELSHLEISPQSLKRLILSVRKSKEVLAYGFNLENTMKIYLKLVSLQAFSQIQEGDVLEIFQEVLLNNLLEELGRAITQSPHFSELSVKIVSLMGSILEKVDSFSQENQNISLTILFYMISILMSNLKSLSSDSFDKIKNHISVLYEKGFFSSESRILLYEMMDKSV